MVKICKWCGKPFEASGTQAYCSDIHYAQCEICGKQFEVNPHQPRRTCSDKCRAIKRQQKISQSTKICELCGKPFVPRNNTARYCDDDHYLPCPICNRPVLVKEISQKPRCCSKECTAELRRRTSLEKYGFDVPTKSKCVREKLKESAFNSLEQRKQTNLIRYGVANPAKSDEIRKKISDTVKSEECQSKMRSTMVKRYGVPFSMQNPELLAKYSETVQKKYGVPYYCMKDECRDANGFTKSKLNQHYFKIFQDIGFDVEQEFNLGRRSYDFRIGDTLIEIDPTITHNSIMSIYDKQSNGLYTDYHKDKTNLAKQNGYHCIHIFNWDNFDKVLDVLKHRSIIYARKCIVREISKSDVDGFLNLYHLQNTCKGQTVRLGLYYNGQLVQVMTFGKPRYNKRYQWELLRLCTASGLQITGGASKLFKYFVLNYKPDSIISYCDASKFSGSVYGLIGMQYVHQTAPNKIWSRGTDKITNNLLIRRGFDQLFGTNFGKGTSNEQLMLKHNWLPVYDCGQYVYEWRNQI